VFDMKLLQLLLGFIPLILFYIFAGLSTANLPVAIIISLVATIGLGYKDLRRGFVLNWGTLLFFVFLYVVAVSMNNVWAATHTGILLTGILAAIVWISLLSGHPFTEQYARLEVDRSRWQHPVFIRVNRIMTAFWGCILLASLGLSIYGLDHEYIRGWLGQILQFGIFIAGVLFTKYYPGLGEEEIPTERILPLKEIIC
jgi:hypothetical protein